MSWADDQIRHLNLSMERVEQRLDKAENKLDLIETFFDDIEPHLNSIEGVYDKPYSEIIEIIKQLKNSFDTIDEEGYDSEMHQLSS